MLRRSWIKLGVCLSIWFFAFGCAHTSSNLGEQANSTILSKILERGEVVVGTSLSQPPFSFKDKDGSASGLDISVAERLADGLGVKLRIEPKPFNQLLGALKKGEVDIVLSGMTVTPYRNRDVLFARPYFLSHRGYASATMDIVEESPLSKLVAEGRRVGVLQGSTHEKAVLEANNNANISYGANYEALFQMLGDGKVELVVGEHPSCAVAGLLAKNTEAKIVMANTYEPIGAAIRPGDTHFLNWLNNFFDTIEDSGEAQELLEHWLESNVWDNW